MKKLIKLYLWINKPLVQKSILADFILFIPRFICGLLLAFNFGDDKFGMPWSPEHLNLGLFEVVYWFPKDVEAYGGLFAVFPVLFAWMGAFSEAVGGLFLAFGLKTRLASFLIICTMLVAIFAQKWGQGIWGILPAAGFLWVGFYSITLGSGRFGIDFLIDKKMRK